MQNDSSSRQNGNYLSNDVIFSSAFPPFTPFLEPRSVMQHQDQINRSVMQHQDQINRTALCLTRLRETAMEVESLRMENEALRSVNRELHNHISMLIQASVEKLYLSSEEDDDYGRSGVTTTLEPAVNHTLHSCGNGAGDEVSEDESPTSVMEPKRLSLPKSISVRSSGYLKMSHTAVPPANKTRSQTRTGLTSPLNAAKVYVSQGKQKEEPLELEVYNQGMFKTELCNKWQETGACPYGDNCQFAHGIEELRPVIRHPRYKTEVCRMVLAGDICPYGHRCHFRHALTEQERFSSGHLKPRAIKHNREVK